MMTRHTLLYKIIPAWIFGGLALLIILALAWAGLRVAGLRVGVPSPVWLLESLIVWAIGSLLGVMYVVVFA